MSNPRGYSGEKLIHPENTQPIVCIRRRLIQAAPVLVLATFVVFGLLKLMPGDIAITLAGENATEARIAEIRALYGLDRPFLVQYGKTWRTIAKLSLPDRFLKDTADNAPETRSERMFTELDGYGVTDPTTGRRRGLKTAIATVRGWRRR